MNKRMEQHRRTVLAVAAAMQGQMAVGDEGPWNDNAEPVYTKEQWEEIRNTQELIRKDDAPKPVFEQYYADDRPEVRKTVAIHCPYPDILQKMAGDSDVDVKEKLAGNEHTPASILNGLMEHRSWAVHAGIASNPSTDAETQKKLCDHVSVHVIEELAGNRNIVPEVAEHIFNKHKGKEEHTSILYELARNKRAPKAVLEAIEKMDKRPWLAEQANRTLSSIS